MSCFIWYIFFLAAEAKEDSGGIFDIRVILVFGAVIAVMIIMPRLLRKNIVARKRLEQQYVAEVNNRLNVKSEADSILIQIVDTGREINALLDTKIRVLNKLIKDAEAVADRLEKFSTGDRENIDTVVVSKKNTNSDVKSIRQTELASNRSETSLSQPEAVPDNQPQQNQDNSGSSGSGRWKNGLRQKISLMADEGRSVESIARLMRLSTSEVSLMLDLINADKSG